MAKMPPIEVEIVWTNKAIIRLISDYLGIEVLNNDAFGKRINEIMIGFVVPKLGIEQMKQDGIIKDKK